MQKSHVKGPTGDSGVSYKSINDILKHRAILIPEREAFVVYHSRTQRQSINYATLYEDSRKFAASLTALGIKNRDKVVFYLSNSIEFVIAQVGVLMIGAIPVNTYINAYGCSDLMNILKKIKPVAIILERSFSGTNRDIQDLKFECVSLKYIIATDVNKDDSVCLSYRSLLDKGPLDDNKINNEVNPHDVAMVLRTSGTTGKPKYISFSYELFLYQTLEGESTTNGKTIKLFTNAFLSYAGGHPLKTITAGTTRVTMHGHRSAIELRDSLSIVDRECCNVLSLSFSSVNKIVTQKLHIPASVKVITLGGTPLTKDAGKLLDEVPRLRCRYGSLETGPISTLLVKRKNEMENNIGGYPVNNVEIKIIDDNEFVVDRGVTGKILVRVPFPCLSFMKEDDEEDLIVSGEWMDTKDVGYISENGKLYVLGRDIDNIKTDECGRHIAEVENTFRDIGIEGIEDLVVLPIPDDEFYQRVCVCIIRKPGASLTESEFLDIVKENKVATELIPKYVLFMDSFPMTVSDKIRRNALLEQVMKNLLPKKV